MNPKFAALAFVIGVAVSAGVFQLVTRSRGADGSAPFDAAAPALPDSAWFEEVRERLRAVEEVVARIDARLEANHDVGAVDSVAKAARVSEFGFLINPPIALYYMQGLNTTPVHGHTALFGVYGLLSLGLVLVVSRVLTGGRTWNTRSLRVSFWCMNGGLALMVGLSLLPIGLAQTVASVDRGLWYARSAEFLQQPWIQQLRWLRLVGDSVFLFGVASFAWFVVGLKTGWSLVSKQESKRLPVLQAA